MKKLILVAFIGLIGALGITFAAKLGPNPPGDEKSAPAVQPLGKLVVHEWGTFTGFAGSDGVHLPFNTVLKSDLPKFVVNRQQQAMRLDPKMKAPPMFLKGGGLAALVRMETPVVYFYADHPGDVRVRVDFPQGSLTEFFPPVQNMGPHYGLGFGEPGAMPAAPDAGGQSHVPDSFLDWGNVRIIPHPTSEEAALIPTASAGDRYEFARNTDSALVQSRDADGTMHNEKFLFYRGLGNFALQVTLVAKGADHFELNNASKTPITSAFLIQVDGDKHLRFARFENITGKQPLTLPSAVGTQDDLADAIVKSLVADGLYEKESRAMVQTWKSTWLDDAGTRVLYFVPRAVTDSLLPLHLTPAPDQTVRVLVGRIDILTPEQESRLGHMMAVAGKEEISDEDAKMLIGLGRFLDPAMERLRKLTGDAEWKQTNLLYQAFSQWQTKHK